VALALVGKTEAESQVQFQPSWAVTQFTTHNGLDPAYGVAAADAVNGELARTSKYQMIPPTVVASQIKTLTLTAPLQGIENLLRVGQELRANTIVNGDVIATQIKNVGGGKQARVAMRAVAYDVASGLPINGAAVIGISTTRSGSDVTDEALIKDSIRAGANLAIRDFQQHQLPGATVLNTLTDRAYINQGTRAGFAAGQEVVITRGREEVATGHISDLEPDESSVIIERSFLGVAPGDHIRAIYPVPEISFEAPFTKNGSNLSISKPSLGIGNNAGLISLLVVVGLVGVLLGNGGNSQNVLNSVTARAEVSDGIPGVLVQWSPSTYAKGNSQLAAWQIWRSDQFNAPVAVTQGNVRSVVDQYSNTGLDTQYQFWTYAQGLIGGTVCNDIFQNETIPATLASLTLGTSYTYQVELVYVLSSIDLPIVQTSGSTASSGSTSGSTSTSSTSGSTSTSSTTGSTTSGSTTTGGTTSSTSSTSGSTSSTSGSTGSTSTTGASTQCYFLSPKQSSGTATPLPPPILGSPGSSAIGPGAQTTFQWTGSARASQQEIEYIIQFSNSPGFPSGSGTYTYPHTITSFAAGTANSGNSVVVPQPLVLFGANGLLPPAIANAATVFYRIGARAVADSPGPVPDPLTHQPYIFCLEPGTFSETNVQNPGNPSAKSRNKLINKHRARLGS
jgi:hypothetical protein